MEKLRIGLFTDTYYPRRNGVATSVYMLKENLESQGHEVYVFTTTDPDAPDFERNVKRIPSIPFKTQRLGTIISPALYRRVSKLNLDIVHTHTEYTLGCFGRIIARRLGIPYIHTMHTIWEEYTDYITRFERFESTARNAARKLTASFCNSADLVITPTDKIVKLLSRYGVQRPLRIIPSGITLDKFRKDRCDMEKVEVIRSELGIMPGEKVLLNIGRVAPEKNLHGLISGLREYLLLHPLVKLLIVGDGPAKAELEKLAKDLGIKDLVIFAGTQPWDKINLYYRLGDIFVGASQSETQGLTYIEAMASGLSVVAKKDSCLDGVLLDGENGFFFTDAEGLVSAVDNLLSNQELLDAFSQRAFEAAREFSADTYASRVAAVYAEMKEDRMSGLIGIS